MRKKPLRWYSCKVILSATVPDMGMFQKMTHYEILFVFNQH